MAVAVLLFSAGSAVVYCAVLPGGLQLYCVLAGCVLLSVIWSVLVLVQGSKF